VVGIGGDEDEIREESRTYEDLAAGILVVDHNIALGKVLFTYLGD
jgi:hypothetical protein